jgi:hypothetical protein
MIPVFERAKTFHALDRAATAIGLIVIYVYSMLKKHVRIKISTSVFRWTGYEKIPTLLGPQLLSYPGNLVALTVLPTDSSPPEDGNRTHFRNIVFL